MSKKNNKLPVLLFAFANDKQTPTGYLDQLVTEREAIEEALRQIESDGLCQVELIPDARLDSIVKTFQRFKNRVVLFHFAGHANEYELILETAYRENDKISGEGFAGFLAAQNTLEVIFLNGCATEAHAQQLAEKDIPHVIATKRAVGDYTAKTMAQWFYGALGTGDTIQEAFQKSCDLLSSQRKQLSIHQRGLGRPKRKRGLLSWELQSTENINWSIPKAAANPLYRLPSLAKKKFPQAPFPNAKPYDKDLAQFFWGRDYEIRACYDQMTAPDAARICLLYGATGVGKTSFLQAGLLPRLSQKFKVMEEFDTQKLTNNNERQFIFLDHITTPNKALLHQILDMITNHPNLYVLLSCRLAFRDDWAKTLGKQISWAFFYLAPITQSGIQRLFHNLKIHIQIEENVPEQIQGLLLRDKNTPLTPLLQYLLHLLWKKAKDRDYDTPYLSWKDYETWQSNKAGGWQNFILQQLAKIDSVALDSGLLLQILKDVSSSSVHSSKGIAISDLAQKYKSLGSQFFDYLTALQRQRLLSTSARNQIHSTTHLRLSHSLLQLPLINLLNDSKRPIQEIQRWFGHHLQLPETENSLPKVALDLIAVYLKQIPALDTKELALLLKSQAEQKNKQQRKRVLLFVQIVLTIVILMMGHWLDSPYLLLFVILLVVLYPRAG